MFDRLTQDFRYAIRGLVKSPLFSVTVLILITFGIGLNMTVSSIADGFIRRPMPGIPRDNRLVMLSLLTRGGGEDPENSYLNYTDLAAQTKSLRGLFAYGLDQFTASLDKEQGSFQVRGSTVAGDYFGALRLSMAAGRPFTPEDEINLTSLPAIISYRFWQDHFGSSPDALGKTILRNSHPATIVGVAPTLFQGLNFVEYQDVWLPLLAYARADGSEQRLTIRKPEVSRYPLLVYGELRPGVSLTQAQAELDTISRRLQAAYPADNKNKFALVQPYSAGSGHNRSQQVVIFGLLKAMVVVVLLIISANIANMMILRVSSRQRDLTVRRALGGSRWRIFMILMAEGLCLAGAALVLGYLFSMWASRAALRLIPHPPGDSIVLDFSPDWRTAIYGASLALVSALFFTVPVLIKLSREDLVNSLKAAGSRTVSSKSKLSVVLTAGQFAFSFALLAALSVVYGSLASVNALNLRSQFDRILVISLGTERSATSIERNAILLDRVYQSLREIPGVELVSYSQQPAMFSVPMLPLTAPGSQQRIRVQGNLIGPDYFRLLGVRGINGRDVSIADRGGSLRTAIVNQRLAHALWPDGRAVGRAVVIGDNLVQITGVVPNGVLPGFQYHAENNLLFLPEQQNPPAPGAAVFYIRHNGATARVAQAATAAIHRTDPALPVRFTQTMVQQMENVAGPLLMIVGLLSIFAIGALVVAAIGLYAVVAAGLSSRTREFGVRLALGATPGEIVWMEVKRAALFIAIGSAMGLALSVVSTPLLRNAVFGIGGASPSVAYSTSFAVLALVGLVAHYVPALRASRTNPTDALREE
jgi:predicted permease